MRRRRGGGQGQGDVERRNEDVERRNEDVERMMGRMRMWRGEKTRRVSLRSFLKQYGKGKKEGGDKRGEVRRGSFDRAQK